MRPRHTALRRPRGGGEEVWDAAAATHAKVAATRLHPRHGCPDDPFRLREFVTRFALEGDIFDRFSGQRTLDENDLAVEMRHASPFLIERFHPHCGAHRA